MKEFIPTGMNGWKTYANLLHMFCDASYGTVAYLKFLFKTDKLHCSFAMLKTRLAPIYSISFPRVKLNAAVPGVRLYKLIIKEVDLRRSTTTWKYPQTMKISIWLHEYLPILHTHAQKMAGCAKNVKPGALVRLKKDVLP